MGNKVEAQLLKSKAQCCLTLKLVITLNRVTMLSEIDRSLNRAREIGS